MMNLRVCRVSFWFEMTGSWLECRFAHNKEEGLAISICDKLMEEGDYYHI